MRFWAEPFTTLRLPKLFDLHADPYERADITSNTYVVLFDKRGLVVGHEQITKSVPLSLAFSVTIPTGGPPKALTALEPQHHWGMSLLKPLPKTLNAANDIDAGMHGLEQRGTPLAVGQRTLASP
jgi:hypothetical protein